VVFVCENNKYGMGTSAERSSSNTEYFTRGDKIPGLQVSAATSHISQLLSVPLQVNGMDIIATSHAVRYARKWAVEGNGPLLLEFVTYRYGGHSYVTSSCKMSCALIPAQNVGPRYHVPYP